MPTRRRPTFRPLIDEMEPRVLPATLTWTGIVDANWNDGTVGVSTNWSGNALPATGDTLIFAAGAANLTNVNNTTANNNYLLQFTGSAYSVSGNAIGLTGLGISDSSAAAVSLTNITPANKFTTSSITALAPVGIA
jgi:fibronectin-binding autotransporter adhesin